MDGRRGEVRGVKGKGSCVLARVGKKKGGGVDIDEIRASIWWF